MMEDQAIEQRKRDINDQPQNPEADQLEIEINLPFWNQGLKNFEEVVIPENSAGNPEVELDPAVKATVSPNENEEEEPAKMAYASASGSEDDEDIEINVEDVDDSSDEEPLLSQQHIPSTSGCSRSGKQEMSTMPREESTAAQDAEASNHVVKESLSHGYRCIDALLNTLTCTCGKKYPNIKSLSAHIIYFNKERNYQCDYCERHFSNLIVLINHLKDSHEDEVEPWAPLIDEGQRRSKRIRKEPERYGTNLSN